MTRDQQLKTLNSPKASKEQLREALANALGVPYERAKKEKETSLYSAFCGVFLKAYKKHTGFDYSFRAKDGVAVSRLIDQIQCLIEYKSPADALATFEMFIEKLPDWYKQNAFSLTVINNKFNEIVASIRKNGEKTGITDDYKARVLNDLTT